MKPAPYSLLEAERISTQFQSLAGRPYNQEHGVKIECIAIAPFDQMSREKFIAYYLLFNDHKKALEHEYRGLLYNVLVIAASDDKYEIFHEDIHSWHAKNSELIENAEWTKELHSSGC